MLSNRRTIKDCKERRERIRVSEEVKPPRRAWLWVVAVLAVAAALVIVAVVVWVLGPGIDWWLRFADGVQVGDGISESEKEALEAKDRARGRITTYLTGVLAAAAMVFTAINAFAARRTATAAQQTAEAAFHSATITERGQQRTHELTEQGLVTSRYTAAIEQLGSDKLDVRLGGIYALERIARDSERDHPTVMAVLAAFVREHSHDPDAHIIGQPADQGEEGGSARRSRPRLRPDLQAALTVIGRRNTDHDTDPIDLSGADLSGASLTRASLLNAVLSDVDLSDANLADADLTGATLIDANLQGADLSEASLADVFSTDATLSGASLTAADLSDARLTNVNLSGANLTDADLSNAYLHYVDLAGADLTDATLTGADLRRAQGLSEKEIRKMTRSVKGARFGPPPKPAEEV